MGNLQEVKELEPAAVREGAQELLEAIVVHRLGRRHHRRMQGRGLIASPTQQALGQRQAPRAFGVGSEPPATTGNSLAMGLTNLRLDGTMAQNAKRGALRALSLMMTALMLGASPFVPAASANPTYGWPATLNGFVADDATDGNLDVTCPISPAGVWVGFGFGGVGHTVGAPCFGVYTYTSPVVTLVRVTDAFCYGDQFVVTVPTPPGIVFPLITKTSTPGLVQCGGSGNPDVAFNDPNMSHGCWIVQPGSQSIWLGVFASPFGGGGAWLRVDPISNVLAVLPHCLTFHV